MHIKGIERMTNLLTLHDIALLKGQRKVSMVSCYDATSASIANASPVDMLYVGDSLATTIYGFDTTLHATIEMMVAHTQAVSRKAPLKPIVADMPFLTCSKGISHAIDCAGALMRAGAHGIKIEGVLGHEDVIQALVNSGIPVVGHVGLTPQSIYQIGEFKVQGKGKIDGDRIKAQTKRLHELGICALVFECVPETLAQEITQSLPILTIGIGAGRYTDGQVLVWQDLLGMDPSFKPKFLRHFGELYAPTLDALTSFHEAVVKEGFPSDAETYHG